MPYTTTITLTSLKDPLDQRCIAVSHGSPTPVGRASRSGHGNLKPSVSNAFFTSPVVSRYHAELKVNEWAASGEQITLIDKNSLHGTFVNGRRLAGFKPMALHTGDVIQFGAQVSRGSETHDGVAVTYDRVNIHPEPASQYFTPITNQTLLGRSNSQHTSNCGYHVPDVSDDESDMMSDDAYSISSYDDHESEPTPSKITPEQPKPSLGSAEQPIDLENIPPPLPSRPPVINLDGDDEDLYGSTFRPGRYRPQSPTLQNFEKKSSPELNFINLSQESVVSEFAPAVVDDVGNEKESIFDHNTGLTGLLNKTAVASSDRDDESENCESCSEDEGFDYPDEEEEDELHNADANVDAEQDETNSIASDMIGSDADDLFEDDEPHSYSSKKQASPELGSMQSLSPSTAAEPKDAHPPISSAPKPLTQPPYDPVRASASLSNVDAWWKYPSKRIVTPMSPPLKPYTYAPPPVIDTVVSPHADVSNSSRWDVAPDAINNLHEPVKQPGWLQSSAPGYSHSYEWPFTRVASIQPFGLTHEWSAGPAPAFDDFSYVSSTNTKPPAPQAAAEAEKTPAWLSKKIRVGDLLEADIAADIAEACKPPTTPVSNTTSANGKKRKADEMDVSTVDPNPIESIITPEAHLDPSPLPPLTPSGPLTPDSAEPPARRRKVEETSPSLRKRKVPARRNIMGKAVKVAAAVTVGSVGTMAFLISPLVDKVIDLLP